MKCRSCGLENTGETKFCGGCGAPLTSREKGEMSRLLTVQAASGELTTGTLFAGRFEVIEELGHGGMGRVYKVFDTKVKEKVALKLIRPEIVMDQGMLERFGNELRLARRIRHKNVCGMFDVGEADGVHYITMEYVHGEDLKSMIHMSGSLSVGMVLSVGKQVCEGLAEAHGLGVVHRDLKPQNIMIDKGGNAKIMDFGIARSVKEKGITGAGVMIGTPEYMSPEQAEAKEVDHRSDIYSLGVILYEMSTSRVPFEGETALSIAMKHKGEMPKNPKQLNVNIPDDLSGVILKCLEKDKSRRYQSASEVRSELEKIEKGIPTTERVVPRHKTNTSRQITVKFQLKKLILVALGIAVLAVMAIVILNVLPTKKAFLHPSGKPSLAVIYFENNTGDEKLDHWRKALAELITSDITQSKYVNVLSGDRLFNIFKRQNLLNAKSFSSEDLKKVAEEGGVENILRGSYAKAGETIRISTTLQNVKTGEVLGAERVEGKGEDAIFAAVDELTKKVKADLKLSPQEISADFDKEIGKITTDSPEAYKYYSEARRQHHDRRNPEAIQLYQKAVSIDPGFAMAYRGMAAAYVNLGLFKKQKEAIQKAMELVDRISEKERYLIQGQFYYLDPKTFGKAIESFHKLLEIYPDDSIGTNYLGLIYNALEEWDKALKYHEMAYKVSKDVLSCTVFAQTLRNFGLFQKARDVYEDFLKNISDNPDIHRDLGWNYLDQAKFDLALAEADKAFLLDPKDNQNVWLKGDIFFLQDNLAGAEGEYHKLLEVKPEYFQAFARMNLAAIDCRRGNFGKAIEQGKQMVALSLLVGEKNWEARSRGFLAYRYWKGGNFRMAESEVEAMIKIADMENLVRYKIGGLNMRSILHIERKSLSEASNTAAEMKKLIDSLLFKKQIRWYFDLMGYIELRRNNLSKAINYYEKAFSLDPSPQIAKDSNLLDDLGMAYFKNGDLEKARQVYEKINSQISSKWDGDIYVKSFYMLGRVADQGGDREKASEYYRKFLDLWKHADPGLPEVEDAKKRLEGLEAK